MMSQSSSKTTRTNSDDDESIESDRLSPPNKRHCQTSNSSCSGLIDLASDESKNACKSCDKQENLLKTFNCPSLHEFCLNCIFNWTQKHIQSKTSPKCLQTNCDYHLKSEDLEDLPISIKDHQVLLQLIELKSNSNSKIANLRLKCDKCYLYIDQQNFYIHHNECQGRSLTIPCEICYCPVLINDYEQHMLICNNDDNSTLSQFLFKHLQNPNIDEKMIKMFICSWQRKHRGSMDIYEMIEELNQSSGLSKEQCDLCKNSIRSDEFHFLNCQDNHSLCFLCFKQHIQNQMNNNQILTCYQCDYHLQDRDLSTSRILTNEQIVAFQNYQNTRILQSYQELFSNEYTYDMNLSIPQQQATSSSASTNDDTPRRKCDLCLKQHLYGDIFVLNCNCKICYDCFANDVNQQRTKTNHLLICSLCRSPIKHNDLGNLRLPLADIHTIQLYQQGKLFESEHAIHFNKPKTNQATTTDTTDNDDYDLDLILLNQQQCLPKYWTLPMLNNFIRHTLDAQSTEYKFVADKFLNSWLNLKNHFHLSIPQVPFPGPLHPPPPPPPTVSANPRMALRPVPTSSMPQTSMNLPPPSVPIGFPPQMNPVRTFMNNFNGRSGPSQSLPPPPLPPPPQPGPSLIYPQAPFQLHPVTNSTIQQNTLPPHNIGQPLPPPPPMQLSAPQPPLHAMPTVNSVLGSVQVPMPRSRARPGPIAQQSAPARSTRPMPPITHIPTVIQIERIQNQRWYKQYSAHECEFRQKLGKQTEQWLFHGCDERASKNIELECFNRSYAGQHAVAFGQGCYFARDSVYSHSYSLPDRNGIRRMFLARVLVGNTAQGNSTMRVPPPGFDTTGDGQNIFVTYHDSQAYAEYLISYR